MDVNDTNGMKGQFLKCPCPVVLVVDVFFCFFVSSHKVTLTFSTQDDYCEPVI